MSIEGKVRIEGTGKFRGDTMIGRMKDEIELLSRAHRGGPDGGRTPADRYHEARRDTRSPVTPDTILHVLEQLGYIRASSEGAVATEQTRELFAHLNEDLDDIIRLVNAMKKP